MGGGDDGDMPGNNVQVTVHGVLGEWDADENVFPAQRRRVLDALKVIAPHLGSCQHQHAIQPVLRRVGARRRDFLGQRAPRIQPK